MTGRPDLAGVRPGDELLVVDTHRPLEGRAKEVRVHKVGRTLVHVLRQPEYPERGTDAYRIENGVANDGYGHSRLVTRGWLEEEGRRASVQEALRRHGVEVWRGNLPVPVLEKVLAVIEEEAE